MPTKVFLHGWGQSEAIWMAQKERFADALYLNLPGHGGAPDEPARKWFEHIRQQLPSSPYILIGWSLGGILALNMLLETHVEEHPQTTQHLAGLVLVGSTPSFIERPGWAHGCDHATFEAFKQAVNMPEKELNRAMSRFFALMLHGDELPRRSFNQLARHCVDRQHPPSREGLAEGLWLLANLDLRRRLGELTVPVLVMHGLADAIVSPAAGRALAEAIPNADWHGFKQTGHAPFLTQSDHFNNLLETWCQTR